MSSGSGSAELDACLVGSWGGGTDVVEHGGGLVSPGAGCGVLGGSLSSEDVGLFGINSSIYVVHSGSSGSVGSLVNTTVAFADSLLADLRVLGVWDVSYALTLGDFSGLA